jgi:heterotetrameric sarcosine oxidase gamma subunit
VSAHDAVMGLGTCAADKVEIAALRDRARELEGIAHGRRIHVPPLGGITATAEHLVLGVRPERWLILAAPAAPGAAASAWQAACAGIAATIDLSSALCAFHLTGPEVPQMLARGCRLDLRPDVFREWGTAATSIAQVPVTLAALPWGWLLLTPATLAQHFHEWLVAVGKPFGLKSQPDLTLGVLLAEHAASRVPEPSSESAR